MEDPDNSVETSPGGSIDGAVHGEGTEVPGRR